MSTHFLTRRVYRLVGWLWYPGLPRVLVSTAFPFAFHILVFFHSLFFICHWISFVFLLYDQRICTHSVDPSLTHFLGEFPGLGLALVPAVLVPKAEHRCAWSRNLDPNFCTGRGRIAGGPWHLAAVNVATRLPCTPSFYSPLMTCRRIQRDNSNPEQQLRRSNN